MHRCALIQPFTRSFLVSFVHAAFRNSFTCFYTFAYTHTYNPEHPHIHTYVHTYLHTYIHTCMQSGLVRFGCVVWCGAGQAVARTPHDGEDSLSVQALGFSWLCFFDVGSGVYNLSPRAQGVPAATKYLFLRGHDLCDSVLLVTLAPCMPDEPKSWYPAA